MDGATLISTISLVDMDVENFSSNIYIPTSWTNYTKTIVRDAPSLKNPSCSKLDFSPPSLAVAAAVAAVLPSPAILSSATSKAACHVPADLQRGSSDPVFLPSNLLFADQQSPGATPPVHAGTDNVHRQRGFQPGYTPCLCPSTWVSASTGTLSIIFPVA